MADTLLDIEKKVRIIHKSRREVEKLNETINQNRDDVVRWLKENNKTFQQIGEFSIVIKQRDKNFADFELLKKLIEQGVIPPETMKNSKIELLQVTSKADFELQGNKFIRK